MSAPIIITLPNDYLGNLEDTKIGIMDVAASTPSRKRRLDHLSWEEKMQRKKLKNRVAAQTSRDRKKAKMDEMEDRISHLEETNERLSSEVASLKALNERLLGENLSLRETGAARRVAGTHGPAESYPQQKEGSPAALRAARLLLAMCLLSQISSHTSTLTTISTLCKASPTLSSKRLMLALQNLQTQDGKIGQCPEGSKVVGAATMHLESSETSVIDAKHDVDRIMLQHSYAHPYSKSTDTENIPNKETNDGDKGDVFYENVDEANDCITVEVPCEEHIIEVETKPIYVDTEFNVLTNDGKGITLECDMKLLSPLSLSPQSMDENLPALSPSHTSLSSDLGYESIGSPFSEPESMDISDFWCESFSELFPDLV